MDEKEKEKLEKTEEESTSRERSKSPEPKKEQSFSSSSNNSILPEKDVSTSTSRGRSPTKKHEKSRSPSAESFHSTVSTLSKSEVKKLKKSSSASRSRSPYRIKPAEIQEEQLSDSMDFADLLVEPPPEEPVAIVKNGNEKKKAQVSRSSSVSSTKSSDHEKKKSSKKSKDKNGKSSKKADHKSRSKERPKKSKKKRARSESSSSSESYVPRTSSRNKPKSRKKMVESDDEYSEEETRRSRKKSKSSKKSRKARSTSASSSDDWKPSKKKSKKSSSKSKKSVTRSKHKSRKRSPSSSSRDSSVDFSSKSKSKKRKSSSKYDTETSRGRSKTKKKRVASSSSSPDTSVSKHRDTKKAKKKSRKSQSPESSHSPEPKVKKSKKLEEDKKKTKTTNEKPNDDDAESNHVQNGVQEVNDEKANDTIPLLADVAKGIEPVSNEVNALPDTIGAQEGSSEPKKPKSPPMEEDLKEEEEELMLTSSSRPVRNLKKEKPIVKIEKPKREHIPSKRFSPNARLPQYTTKTKASLPLYPEVTKLDQSLPSSSNSSMLTDSPSPVAYIVNNPQYASMRLDDSIASVESNSMINHESYANWTSHGPKPRELEGMAVSEATPILEKWFAENPMYIERNGRSELALQIGWSKYRIKKWFNEQRQKFALNNGPPPKLTPSLDESTRQNLNTIFNKRQFVDKKQSEDLGGKIGLPGSEVYSWIFYHRCAIYAQYVNGILKELPSQMKVLEAAYQAKNRVDGRDLNKLMAESNATVVQISGYFRSRRHIDRCAGKDVPSEGSLPRLYREATGLDFIFPDAHWEFSVCQLYIDQYSSADEFRDKPINIERLQQQRALARGHMFQFIPLPFNHFSDYENWTVNDIQEFGRQFLSTKALQLIKEIGIEGIHLKLFCPGNERFYRKLIAADLEKKSTPSLTWQEFITVGRYIEQIDEATEKWMVEYRTT